MSTSPARDRYDVVVVGARCAGAAVAMLLARAGLSVLAVERSAIGADTLSTHALTRPGVRQLSRWGVLDDLRSAGTPRVGRVDFDYGGKVVPVEVPPLGDVDGLYAPRRTLLDRVLVDAAVTGGAAVQHRTSVTDLVRDDSGRVTGVTTTAGGRRRTVHSRLVVGADGARSFLARQVGAPDLHRAVASSAGVYTYVPDLPPDAFVNRFRPGLATGVIPTDGGLANVWANVSMTRFGLAERKDPRGYLVDHISRTDPDLGERLRAQVELPLRIFVGRPGHTRQAWGPGWALVGDAVYFKDPLSAHGMTDALIGAELLARAVRELFDTGDEASALDGYARQRAALAEPMRAALDQLTRFEWVPEDLSMVHRALNQAMHAEWDAITSLGPPPGASARAELAS